MAEVTIEQAIQIAVQHHQAGRLAEAEGIYRQILAVQPKHPVAIHLIGVIATQVGQPEVAVQWIRQALDLVPSYAEAHANLASALLNLGRYDEAAAAASAALQHQPTLVDAYINLGLARKGQNKFEDAIAAYTAAAQLNPNHHLPYSNLGDVLGTIGRADEAAAACRRAIELKPDFAPAHYNLGIALRLQGRFDEAAAAYAHAIACNPNYDEAYNNRGAALRDSGRMAEAEAAFARAVELNPNNAAAHSNLGNILKDRGDLDGAIGCYRRAIALNPRLSQAHSNLVYTLYFHPDFDSASLLAEQRAWNDREAQFTPPTIPQSRPAADPISLHPRRLKIGYTSADFRDHVVGRNLLPLFREHDHHAFEIFCYADVIRPDALTQKFQSYADHWRPTATLTHAQLAEQIRHDQLDILVDLDMHMANSRLPAFMLRPAPIQATFAAYPGGTGVAALNFRLTDPHLDPPNLTDADYVETSLRLPHSFWCYDPLELTFPSTLSPAITNGFITFGCLNNFCKVNDHVLALWTQVLQRLPDSRLLLLAPEGPGRQHVHDFFHHHHIASTRIDLLSMLPRPDYLQLYHRIDIGLDTLPYNGHTTSLDSFWMGVPVVTKIGRTVVGRAGWCQLCNLDLPELAAEDDAQFINIATELATDLPRLTALRATLRTRMEASPLMNAPLFARSIEAAYRQMWQMSHEAQ